MSIKKVNICVPMIGTTKEEIIEHAKKVAKSHADIVEWRVDYFEDVKVLEKVIEVLKEIREILKDKEIIFTYRTSAEGGVGNINVPEYMILNKTAALSKLVDYVDIELLLGDTIVSNLIRHAKIQKVKTIMSNHDLDSTPRKELIKNRLQLMLDKGADYAKVACTPRSEEDVTILMEAGKEMNLDNTIVIAMGELGVYSRLHPQDSNSCMTFASLSGQASAPGQVDIEKVYEAIRKS